MHERPIPTQEDINREVDAAAKRLSSLGLRHFVVASSGKDLGASSFDDLQDEESAEFNARKHHMEWEIANGIDPHHVREKVAGSVPLYIKRAVAGTTMSEVEDLLLRQQDNDFDDKPIRDSFGAIKATPVRTGLGDRVGYRMSDKYFGTKKEIDAANTRENIYTGAGAIIGGALMGSLNSTGPVSTTLHVAGGALAGGKLGNMLANRQYTDMFVGDPYKPNAKLDADKATEMLMMSSLQDATGGKFLNDTRDNKDMLMGGVGSLGAMLGAGAGFFGGLSAYGTRSAKPWLTGAMGGALGYLLPRRLLRNKINARNLEILHMKEYLKNRV